jgi:outer membrane lipoprotein carrier protein
VKRLAALAMGLVLMAGPPLARPFPGPQEPASSPEWAVANLEKAIRAVVTLRADFEQLHYSMAVTEPLREKGELLFEKPDRMRWEYRSPQNKVFLYQAGVLETYLPEDNQLIRSPVSQEALETDIFGIFLGLMSFRDAYVVEASLFPTDASGVRQVKLTPREEGDFSHILLEIDEATWLLRRAIFLEWAGNKREFVFSRVRTGVRVPAGAFTLKVPPGTEIIDDVEKAIR